MLNTVPFAEESTFFQVGLEYLNTALQYDPNHAEALLNSAILMQVQ
jgi:hypothetical protein